MNDHLSDFRLDVLAADPNGSGSTEPHLSTCDRCRDRLAAFRAAREHVQTDLRFARIESALRPRPARGRWLLGPGLALAAGLALALIVRSGSPRGGERLKGGAGLMLVDPHGDRVVSARPGDRVALSVGGAGHAFALVLAVDPHGEVEQLWPAHGEQSGPIPSSAAARLEPAFEVTPGSLHLVALYSDAPLDAAPVLRRWREAGERATIAGEAARAEADLVVREGR